MGNIPTEIRGFTTDASRGRSFAGWGVKCDGHLALDNNDKFPYRSEDEAAERLATIENYGACFLPHRVIRVYRLGSGRTKKRPVVVDG